GMTKSEIVAALAEKVGISKKQANLFLEAQADLAYEQAKNTFVIPGLGKLVLAERPARQMVMRFGPKAGQGVEVPRKHAQGPSLPAAADALKGPGTAGNN